MTDVTTQELIQAFDYAAASFTTHTQPKTYNLVTACSAAEECYEYASQLAYHVNDTTRNWKAEMDTWFAHSQWARKAL